MSYTPYGIALPTASPGKSWTRTRSGVPVGCHSRPAFLKSPTNSFFLVSTEITGWRRRRKVAAVAAMCSMRVPIRVGNAFAGLLQGVELKPEAVQQPPHRRGTHRPAFGGQGA